MKKSVWSLASILLVVTSGLLSAPLTAGPASAAELPGGGGVRADSPLSDPTVAAQSVVARGFFWQLTAPQPVVPGTYLTARRLAHHVSHGTRSDRQFFVISRSGSNDVPEAALGAYHHAEQVMASSDPGCGISWTLLAAIGRVESNHGRFGGAQLGADGVSRPGIVGPRLDGAGPFAAIRDTDHGALDGDPVWDRAVGQMQFLPGTWASVGRDGDGDGVANPNDINDSALAAAVYLCGAGGSLSDQAGMAGAAFRYNHSDYYVSLVLSYQAGYQTGVFAIPSPPPPSSSGKHSTKHHARTLKQTGRSPHAHGVGHAAHGAPSTAGHHQPTPGHVVTPAPGPKPKPTPGPTTPTPTPTPTPVPTPTAPDLRTVSGTWTACGPDYCLDGAKLDLGPASIRGDRAAADFDGDGTVESDAEELAGLVGTHVSLRVAQGSGPLVVYVIGSHGYRNADASFARATDGQGGSSSGS